MHKYGLIITIAVAIIVVYYVVSPYQNCGRALPEAAAACINNTSW